jgi:hypothetical protein
MHLDVVANLGQKGGVYAIDPRISENEPVPTNTARMGDIVRSSEEILDLGVSIESPSPIERVDILNGAKTVQTLRPYEPDPGGRLRVIWQGAEYRGRGRTTKWRGTIKFDQARVENMQKINIWNLERSFEATDDQTITFDSVTTGNFCGCDIWLSSNEGRVSVETDHVSGAFALAEINGDETVLDAGGLDRTVRLIRLPNVMECCSLTDTIRIDLVSGRDNPIWVRVVTEDGFVAWSSPIYVTN